MADGTGIEWTDATWNPIVGCSVVSPGCTNCYAMRLAGTRMRHHPTRAGLTIHTKAGPVWNGEIRLNKAELAQPLRWLSPRRVFVAAHSDVFHGGVSDKVLDEIFAVMAAAPQHTFQVLTKRSDRMRSYLSDRDTPRRIYDFICDRAMTGALKVALAGSAKQLEFLRRTMPALRTVQLDVWPLPNVWVGVSVEDQTRADERIPHLLQTPAALRWVSAEPLLGPVDFRSLTAPSKVWPHSHQLGDAVECRRQLDAFSGATGWVGQGLTALEAEDADEPRTGVLNWIVVGGESGPGARPMHPDWVRKIRDHCRAADVPFFFKQWGQWWPAIDRDRDDPDWRQDYHAMLEREGRSKRFRVCNLAGGFGFHGDRVHIMENVGKARAGAELDGREHREWPK